jgi:hypothetical protein
VWDVINFIIAESDSLKTVEAYNGSETWLTGSAVIFADCVFLAVSVGEVFHIHCWMKGNKNNHN